MRTKFFQSEYIWGQKDLNWILDPNNFDLEFMKIEKFIWIQSLELTRIDFQPIYMKRGWKQISEWIRINLNGSKWISLRNFYQGTLHIIKIRENLCKRFYSIFSILYILCCSMWPQPKEIWTVLDFQKYWVINVVLR